MSRFDSKRYVMKRLRTARKPGRRANGDMIGMCLASCAVSEARDGRTDLVGLEQLGDAREWGNEHERTWHDALPRQLSADELDGDACAKRLSHHHHVAGPRSH